MKTSKLMGILAVTCLAVALAACSHSQARTPEASGKPVDASAEADAQRKAANAGKELTLAFVGDIMMGTTYPESPKGAYLPANDGKDLFRDAKEVLSGVDIACGNLEGTLLDSGGTPKKCGNPATCFAFRMPQRYVNNLVDAGFDVVGIANNHINDFGPVGTASTQKTLKEAGIKFAGLEVCPTTQLERDGMKIGFAGFGHNRGTMSINDLAKVKSTVAALKKDNDIVIVSFHGGAEGKSCSHVPHKSETAFGENRGNVEAFAHAAVDAGADIVYGHGPHVTRALELYKDHLIVYSLGNFCTPYRMGLSGISGYAPVVTATIAGDGTFKEGQIHSFIQSKGTGPRHDATGSVAKHMRSLTQSDFPATPLSISDSGKVTRK